MGTCLVGSPTQTEVASWGVNPVNQASLNPVVVPVLPARGRPNAARKPVPPFATTPRRMAVAAAATPGARARWQDGLPSSRTRPSGPATRVTASGWQWTPPSARVA
jgi:hypothetical protein